MDGWRREKVLEADGEEKPVVSEYSKWMDGAEKVLEPKDSTGSEHQKAADSPDTTEPDVPDGADGTPGLTRLTTKLRDLWRFLQGLDLWKQDRCREGFGQSKGASQCSEEKAEKRQSEDCTISTLTECHGALGHKKRWFEIGQHASSSAMHVPYI